MISEDALSALGSEYSPEILAAADEPVSAQELSDQLDIPLATCYRRIDELNQAGLLELTDRVRSSRGGMTKVYRRRIDDLRIEFDRDDISIEATGRQSVAAKLDEVWRSSPGREP